MGLVDCLDADCDSLFLEESFSGDKCQLRMIFAVVVEDCSKILELLQRFAHPGSTIMSDSFSSYQTVRTKMSPITEINGRGLANYDTFLAGSGLIL